VVVLRVKQDQLTMAYNSVHNIFMIFRCTILFVAVSAQAFKLSPTQTYRVKSNVLATQLQKEHDINSMLESGISLEQITEIHNSSEFRDTKEDEIVDILDPSIPKKRIIEIQSSIDLPFSAEIAYDCYSDLPRQTDWSSWLHKVEYLGDSTEKSKWTLKFLGFKYSWNAEAVKNTRPHTLKWKSTSGLANFGTVKFSKIDDQQTRMSLKMTLVAPRAAAALFRKAKGLQNFIEEKMILASLLSFRDIVIENDLKQR